MNAPVALVFVSLAPGTSFCSSLTEASLTGFQLSRGLCPGLLHWLRTRHASRLISSAMIATKGSETPAIPGCKTTRRSGRTIHKATRLYFSGILLGCSVTVGAAGPGMFHPGAAVPVQVTDLRRVTKMDPSAAKPFRLVTYVRAEAVPFRQSAGQKAGPIHSAIPPGSVTLTSSVRRIRAHKLKNACLPSHRFPLAIIYRGRP